MTITHAEEVCRKDCGANHGGTQYGAPANGEQPALPSAGCFIVGVTYGREPHCRLLV